MLTFISGNEMADAINEDVKEITELLEQGLIKRYEDGEPLFVTIEDNLEAVKEKLSKYDSEEYFSYSEPLEFARSMYGGCSYDMSTSSYFSTVTLDLDEMINNFIKSEDEMFSIEMLEHIYNSDNISLEFKKTLDELGTEYLKAKIKKMLNSIDTEGLSFF